MRRYCVVMMLVVVSAFCCGAVGGEAGAAKGDFKGRMVELAKEDHIGLLKFAVEHYDENFRDYTGTFYKRELLGGKLSKRQEIDFEFIEKPFCVLMRWRKNAAGVDKMLFVEGANGGRMLVHPTGLLSIIGSLKLDPLGKRALKSSRQPCNQFGFGRTMARMLAVYETARKNGELRSRYLGVKVVNKRRCIGIERTLPQKKPYTSARLVTYFDVEYVLPIASTLYDWDGKLLGDYSYGDLKFNVGLKAGEFAAKANGF